MQLNCATINSSLRKGLTCLFVLFAAKSCSPAWFQTSQHRVVWAQVFLQEQPVAVTDLWTETDAAVIVLSRSMG